MKFDFNSFIENKEKEVIDHFLSFVMMLCVVIFIITFRIATNTHFDNISYVVLPLMILYGFYSLFIFLKLRKKSNYIFNVKNVLFRIIFFIIYIIIISIFLLY